MARLDMPEHPTWIQVISALKGKESRKVGHNTYARRFGDVVHIRYHSTIIAIVEPGKLTVHSGGYHTVTTKQRLNWLGYFLAVTVFPSGSMCGICMTATITLRS